jgi:hypothetical protein
LLWFPLVWVEWWWSWSFSLCGLLCTCRRCDGYFGLVGLDSSDRDQRQADVTYPLEQAMECCLVGDKTMNEGGAVAPLGKAQSVEPGSPSGSQVSLQADFVPSGLAMIAGRCLAHDRKLGGDVVSEHHHMW